MEFIKGEKIEFEYSIPNSESEEVLNIKAIDELDISIKKGEFVSILGHNGSGKSTLAKHMNALLTPTKNSIWINGINSKDKENLWEIRKNVGMVFQNPDNQIIATTVEADIAFGLENLGIPPKEIGTRIDKALSCLKMLEHKKSIPSNLSGGQKQKIAIAGILAMNPSCIVFDEATSMLDPVTRDEVLQIIYKLNKEQGITTILITHHMEEVIFSDRVIVMEKGKIALEDSPRNIFSKYEELQKLNLDLPQVTKLSYELNKLGYNIKNNCLDLQEFLLEIEKIGFKENIENILHKETEAQEEIIRIKNLDYTYSKGSVFEKKALDNINLSIKKGEILGVIGHTGSGKSTLMQHLNLLIKTEKDKIFFKNQDINLPQVKPSDIRQKIGLVFQYPENQLFEETVYKDVAFAPQNMGLSKEEIEKRVKTALEFVGLDESFYNRSPFELSGGQKRRVAIAGILAMKPEVLIFDEPTAGLDPLTKNFILENIQKINREFGTTIILISHSMEDICTFANRVAIMYKGKLEICDKPENIFNNAEKIQKTGLKLPKVTEIFYELNKSKENLPLNIITLEQATTFFTKNLKK